MNSLRFEFWKYRDRLLSFVLGKEHTKRVFRKIFDRKLWSDGESVSGPGSILHATENIRSQLPMLLQKLEVKTILDAPCGDFAWMSKLRLEHINYIGVDIVEELIQENQKKFGNERVCFFQADISTDKLPNADIILCRDCLIHLPTRMIRSTLQNFKRTGARYLLFTNSTDVTWYKDIPVGSYRSINLQNSPFFFPEPLEIIKENESGSRQLCLWEICDLPVEWFGVHPD